MCGWQFVAFLVVSQLFVKGMLLRIIEVSMLPIFKTLGVDAADLQIYAVVITSPWTLKPLIGVLSDMITVYGYHKRYWLLMSILIGTITSICMFWAGTIPTLLVACFMGVNFEMSVIDLLTESRYAEKMREYSESGSDIITFVGGLQSVGTIVTMIFIGFIAEAKLFWVLFLIIVLLAFMPFIPVLAKWLPEERGYASCVHVNRETLDKYRSLFIVVGFTGITGPVVAILVMYTNNIVGLVCGAVLLGTCIVGGYFAFSRTIAHVGLYQVIVRLSKPSMSTALDYFYTADPLCLVDGPNFDYKYYIMYTGVTSACVGLLAAGIYQLSLSRLKYRKVLIITTCFVGLSGLVDLLIVLRVNTSIGIPDKLFYLVGESVLESFVNMLYWIPTSIVISKVCPLGIESATFAFLAGLSNFAGMIAEMLGAVIFEAAGVSKCNFDNLWWLVLCFHMISPVIIGVPAIWLIPDAHQNQVLEIPEDPKLLQMDDLISESDGDYDLNF